MISLFTNPTRALTTSGAKVVRTVNGSSLDVVELAPAYVDLEQWRELLDKARGADGREYRITIHHDVKVKPCPRSAVLPSYLFADVASRSVSRASVGVFAMPGAGKSTLARAAIEMGMRVLDSDAVMFALMDRPFGNPKFGKKQNDLLTHDQAVILSSLALAPKTPFGRALFLSNLSSGLASRAWHTFMRSSTTYPVVTFLVTMPPDVLHDRICKRAPKTKEAQAKLPSLDLIKRWCTDTVSLASTSSDYDFIIEIPDRGEETLFLSDIFKCEVVNGLEAK